MGLTEQQAQLEHIGGSRAKQEYLAKARELVDQTAVDLQQHADDMSADLLRFRGDMRAMLLGMRRAIALQAEIEVSPDQLNNNRSMLRTLVEAMTTSRTEITAFQAAVARIPPLTGRFKRAEEGHRDLGRTHCGDPALYRGGEQDPGRLGRAGSALISPR